MSHLPKLKYNPTLTEVLSQGLVYTTRCSSRCGLTISILEQRVLADATAIPVLLLQTVCHLSVSLVLTALDRGRASANFIPSANNRSVLPTILIQHQLFRGALFLRESTPPTRGAAIPDGWFLHTSSSFAPSDGLQSPVLDLQGQTSQPRLTGAGEPFRCARRSTLLSALDEASAVQADFRMCSSLHQP